MILVGFLCPDFYNSRQMSFQCKSVLEYFCASPTLPQFLHSFTNYKTEIINLPGLSIKEWEIISVIKAKLSYIFHHYTNNSKLKGISCGYN